MNTLLVLALLAGAGWCAWTHHRDSFRFGTPGERNGTRGIQRITSGANQAQQIR